MLLWWQLHNQLLLMGKLQRQRGAGFEREIVNDLAETLGVKTRRNLTQYQVSGEGDLIVGNYVIECKRRREIAVYKFMEQAEQACSKEQTPIVLMRADGEKTLAMMRWADFMKLLGNELTPAQPEVHPSANDGD
jgi:Holliday junction resolvase